MRPPEWPVDPVLGRALGALGLGQPTPFQLDAFDAVSSGGPVLLIAPTGHGKTEAAVVPLLHRLLTTEGAGFRVLYVTPLRALNRDLLGRLERLCRDTGLRIGVRHGDTTQGERTRQAEKPPDLLITTPETVQLLFTGKRLRSHLPGIEAVVIDEVHELAGNERGAQLAVALERLERFAPGFQRIGLSATVGTPEAAASWLSPRGPVRVLCAPVRTGMDLEVHAPDTAEGDADRAKALYCDAETAAVMRTVVERIERAGCALVFVNTRDAAESLGARLAQGWPEVPTRVHHGSLSKQARVEAEEAFKDGSVSALICTSSLELGIDVGRVDLVVQYNSPREVARLVQRIGRSGHGLDRTPKGLIIGTHPDELFESAVIARRAQAGVLEPLSVPATPLDVLANQVAAVLLTERAASREDLFALVTGAAPFCTLQREAFDAVLDQLAATRLVWTEGPGASPRRGTRQYFLDNISMIPDERSYTVTDITTRTPVARLDEGFVAQLYPGARFLVRGRSWRLVEAADDLLVEPVNDLSAVPAWFGEEIPVPYAVASEVGRLRGQIADALARGESARPVLEAGGYPVTEGALRVLEGAIRSQGPDRVPTDRVVAVEAGDGVVAVQAALGSRGNEALGMILASLLAQREGATVGLRTDPYRVFLTFPGPLRPDRVLSLLAGELKPEAVDSLLALAVRHSSYLRHQLLHVGRKFGVVRKDADVASVDLDRFFRLYAGTPFYEEAVAKVLRTRVDGGPVREMLASIQDGSIELVSQRLSHLARIGLQPYRTMLRPEQADRGILLALKSRLESEGVRLLCLACGSSRRTVVAEVKGQPTCDRCGGRMLAAIPLHDHGSADLVRRGARTEEERKHLRWLYANATLVNSYRGRAVLALAGRGIGPETASRLLAIPYDDEAEFLRRVLRAEVQYARTRRFW